MLTDGKTDAAMAAHRVSRPDISLPARSYFAYLPEARRTDPHIAVFCDWLEQQGRDLAQS
jgi:DNA-binding transcriptional LysR family regulator